MDLHITGVAYVTLNEASLGRRQVAIRMGELDFEAGEPMALWAANGVQGMGPKILIAFEGGTLVTLEPETIEKNDVWLRAISAWVPREDASKELLKALVQAVRKGGGSVAGDQVPKELGSLAFRGTHDELLERTRSLEERTASLEEELLSAREATAQAQYMLVETENERKDLASSLESVNDAVRIKAIGMLMSRNSDMANLKLQTDMYQEQIGYLARDNEKLKSQGKVFMASKQATVSSLSKGLAELREQIHALRCVLYRESANERGLNIQQVLDANENVRRRLFFSFCAHFRLARSLSASSSSSAYPLPDAFRLFEQYGALPEDRWRDLLCTAYGVKPELIETQ